MMAMMMMMMRTDDDGTLKERDFEEMLEEKMSRMTLNEGKGDQSLIGSRNVTFRFLSNVQTPPIPAAAPAASNTSRRLSLSPPPL